MPVTVPEGIVGKISRSSTVMAQVMMITDPGMSVDCRVERTRDRGLLSGSYSYSCLLQYVNKGAQIKEGDLVVTSGLDGIFPRGLIVGMIQSIRSSEHGLFLEAVVTPAAKLSEIEEVVVILGIQGGFSIEPGSREQTLKELIFFAVVGVSLLVVQCCVLGQIFPLEYKPDFDAFVSHLDRTQGRLCIRTLFGFFSWDC